MFVENNKLFGHCKLFYAAAGNAHGDVLLDQGFNGRVSEYRGDGASVKQLPLDVFLNENVSLIKIDVEGYEGEVLAGAGGLIRERMPNLYVEMHPGMLNYGYTVDDIINMVKLRYPRIRFYEYREGPGLVRKIASRYFERMGICELSDVAALLADCRNGRRSQTFWMVCLGQ